MTNANDRQVGGSHYQKGALQHWDMVALFELDYFQGNVSKYIFRWREKGGIQDLEKARHYLDKYIEIEKMRGRGELTESILLDALKKFSEDDIGITNVSGDHPPRCKRCVYDRDPDVCKYCGRRREASEMPHPTDV